MYQTYAKRHIQMEICKKFVSKVIEYSLIGGGGPPDRNELSDGGSF